MSTLVEKANQILSEKTEKIIPENIKSGITVFGVEGTLDVQDKPISIQHGITGYCVNTAVTQQETISAPEDFDGIYFDILAMYCLNSQTTIRLAITNVAYTGTAVGKDVLYDLVMYDADGEGTTVGGVFRVPTEGNSDTDTCIMTLNWATNTCSIQIENLRIAGE